MPVEAAARQTLDARFEALREQAMAAGPDGFDPAAALALLDEYRRSPQAALDESLRSVDFHRWLLRPRITVRRSTITRRRPRRRSPLRRAHARSPDRPDPEPDPARPGGYRGVEAAA